MNFEYFRKKIFWPCSQCSSMDFYDFWAILDSLELIYIKLKKIRFVKFEAILATFFQYPNFPYFSSKLKIPYLKRIQPPNVLFHFRNLHPGGIILHYIKVGQIPLGWLWWAISVFQGRNPSFLPYLCRAVAGGCDDQNFPSSCILTSF